MTRALVVASAGLIALAAGLRIPAATSHPSAGGHGFVMPVRALAITQGFGCTSFYLEPVDPACPGGHFHSGLDLAAPAGTTVRATAGGVVLVAAWSPDGYGLRVVVDHGAGMTSLYAHLEVTSVMPGQVVSAGQEVGLVGSTGNSSGPHLHFEVRSHGRPTDPEPLLAVISVTRGGIQ